MRVRWQIGVAAALAIGCVHAPEGTNRNPKRPSTELGRVQASGSPASTPLTTASNRLPTSDATLFSALTTQQDEAPAGFLGGALANENASPEEQLRAALRDERYSDAARVLALPELAALPLRSLIEGFVRLQLHDYDRALDLLTQARAEHPELPDLLDDWLDEALLNSSSYASGLAQFQKSRDPEVLLRVAERSVSDGEHNRALSFVQRAAGFAGGSRKLQARVRALRARIALAQDRPHAALADFRWLALHAPLEPAAAGADLAIAEHFPNSALGARERYARAVAFAEAGRPEETQRELQLVAALPHFRLREGEVLHLRGLAHYEARQFEQAAELLQQAAQAGSHQAINDWYRAGQALSRLGRAREALSLFEKVERSAPKTELTVAARFRIGSEWLVLGEWERAIASHSELLERHPGSEFTEAAQRERAVAWFAVGEYAQAGRWFRKMRMQNPRSSDASLYQLLEAVAYEFDGRPEIAAGVLRDLMWRSPLSFAGQTSRARLLALGEAVRPVRPLPSSPKPSLLPLPSELQNLQRVGFDLYLEDALRGRERQWLSGVDEARGWMQCEGYAQLGAGRRRLVVGMDLASRNGFWDRPELHEDWLWRCLYPEPFADWVGEAAERWQVPAALVYAVMRQESGFRPQVESPAKAKGLMQIIAPTAERIAEELGEPLQTARLASPRDNIRFGVFYLHKLLELFQSHPAPAAAAYNAGPKAALRWQHATAELPVEVFVARIPYDETRSYVQRVLGNLRVYQTLYPELGGLEIPLTLGTSVNAPLASRELQVDPDLY